MLACRTCGRQIYTAASLESLVADERRCPRCGAYLDGERRDAQRRRAARRTNPPEDPGPPHDERERREDERRVVRRRKPDAKGWRPRA